MVGAEVLKYRSVGFASWGVLGYLLGSDIPLALAPLVTLIYRW